MNSKNAKYRYRSPFNFLDPYTKEDEHIFFGRDEEIDEVFMLFEKTNMVVIYGPSGSGKSSMAQCGLVNRFFDWKPIEIRRNSNIIDSFFDAIKIKPDAEDVNEKGLFPAEECQKLRDIFDKLILSTKDENYDPNNNQDLFELRQIIEKLYMNLSVTPFYIFDQFEELFIENQNTNEIENFSLLLSLITRRISYSNVVLCIQTEFFSDLVRLEGYNPNILNYKCEIKDPNEENIKKIIRGTFEKFNINQVTDDSGEEISNDEKEKRIDEIIKRLNRVGSHLPFVQIYLDKLYVLDFEDTYKEQRDLLSNPHEIDINRYPLEFRVEEIKKYGQIDEILESYISNVNTTVITKNNHIGHKGYEHSVVKFLKHFISKKDTRRGIKVVQNTRKAKPNINYYVILGEVKSEIIQSIWGADRSDVDESLGDIIDELLNARILKYRNGVLEFSHNFLVRVVKRISVDEDILEYYKRQFNSAFDTYMMSDKSRKELLSPGQVRNLKGRINEVLGSTSNIEFKENIGDDSLKKEEFWRRSKNMALWRKVSLIGSYIFIGSAAIVYTTYEINRNEIEESIRKLKSAENDAIRLEFNNTITKAADKGINDITEAYKVLDSFPSRIRGHEGIDPREFRLGLKMYHQLLQNYVEEPFYKKKIRLFSKGKREQILSTKSRRLNDQEYVLFALTPTKLYSTKIVLDNDKHKGTWHEVSESNAKITAFEPYKDKGGNIKVLYSNSNGIYDSDWQLDVKNRKLINGKNIAKNLKYIDHLGFDYFVALNEDSDRIWYIGKSKPGADYWFAPFKLPEDKNKKDKIIAVKTFSNDPRTISYLVTRDDFFIVYLHEGKYWEETPKDSFFFKKDSHLDDDVLYSFRLDTKKGLILFEDDRKIYSISFSEFTDTTSTKPKITTKINSYHQSKINSIDNQGDYSLIGSNDKTATLFFDPNLEREGEEVLLKTFKGHTDAVHNVTFLDNDHVFTSSEDGTITLWDISNVENATALRIWVYNQIRLKRNIYNNKIYLAGFDNSEQAHLIELINDSKNKKELKQKNLIGLESFNSNSFDFFNDLIYVGDRSRNMIFVYDQNGIEIKSKRIILPKDLDNHFIYDLKISGKRMAIAANEYVYYWHDLNDVQEVPEKRKIKGSVLNTVDLHPNKNKELLIISSEDKNLYSWDIKTDQIDTLKNAHLDKVRDARFSGDGKYMVSASWDNTAIIWKVMENNVFKKYDSITSHNNDIVTIATDITVENHLIIATGSSDKTIQLHGLNLKISNPILYRIPSIIRHDYAIRSVTFGKNSDIIYSADSRGNIKKWNISTFLKTIDERTAK